MDQTSGGGDRGATLRAAWAGNEWMGSTGGMPVNVVGADHPTEDVVFNRGYSTTGPGIDGRPYAIPDRPLVEGMPSYVTAKSELNTIPMNLFEAVDAGRLALDAAAGWQIR